MNTSEHWITEIVPESVLQEVDETQGWLSLEEATVLFNLARTTSEGAIVEVGSYRGRSTVALAKGALAGGNRPVYAIEPHEEFVGVLGGKFGPEDRAFFYQAMLKTSSYKNVRLINLSSEIITAGWKEPVLLLWIDGDHSYEGVKHDLACWKEHLSPEGYIVFDDATDPALGPKQLINEIVESGEFKFFASVGKIVVLTKTSN